MMTRPPVSMWKEGERAYNGAPEIIRVVYPLIHMKNLNAAATPGAKITYIYNEQAVKLYDEARRTVSGKIETTLDSLVHCGECCRNCKHYSASYARTYDGNFRELQDGRCHRKRATGAKTSASSTCEHFQR